MELANEPKAVVRFSVNASAAPLSSVAANILISARSSRLDQTPAQPRAAIGDSPAVSVRVLLAVKGEPADTQFLAGLPDERPSTITRDSLPDSIHLGGTVNLRPGGDDHVPVMIDVLRDEPDDGCVDRR